MFWGKCIPARGKIKGRDTEAGTNMVDHRQQKARLPRHKEQEMKSEKQGLDDV